MQRVATTSVASTIAGLESTRSQAATLAEGALYSNDPGFFRKRLAERCAARRGMPVAELSAAQWVDGIFRKAALPGRRRRLAVRSVCTAVRLIAGEMIFRADGQAYTTGNNLLQANVRVCLPVDDPELNVRDVNIAIGGRITVRPPIDAAGACPTPADN